MSSTNVKEVLEERGKNYGSFQTFSNLSNALYSIILKHYSDIQNQSGNPKVMPTYMVEALHMICHKLSRIVNGDPTHIDSWVDIGGYSQLVADILIKVEAMTIAKMADLEGTPASSNEILTPLTDQKGE